MKIGITFSAFDLFHAGHVKMLEEAKLHYEYLIVGLQTDLFWIVLKKISPHKLLLKDIFN